MPDPVGEAFVVVRPDLTKFTGELEATLTGIVSRVNRQVAAQSRAAAGQGSLRRAFQNTNLSLKENANAIEAASSQLNRFNRGVASTALSMFGLRGATLAATSSFLAGAAAITAVGKAVGIATSFNSQIAVFGAVTGASADELARASEVAKELGANLAFPGVTATDAATAMTELAKAGLSVNEAIAATPGVLQLAQAAGISFAEATELTASALNAFGLAGSEASRVADTFANAANLAQGTIVDVGIALQQSAAVAHQAGLSFRDNEVFITALAQAGLKGSDAGTSLRTAFLRLINPTEKAAKLLDNLGVAIRDAQGNLRPDVFVNLGIALRGLSKEQRDATLATIFGQDAIRSGAILTRQSIRDLTNFRDALDEQGTASRVAQARLTGLAGAGANLSNTVQSIALSLGQKATPALINATNAVTNFIQAVASSPLVTGVLASTASATAGAFSSLANVFARLVSLAGPLASALNAVVQSVGVGSILASVVALKAFFAAARGFSGAAGTFNIFTRIAVEASVARDALLATGGAFGRVATGATTVRAALTATAASIGAFAISTGGLAALTAAFIGTLVFLHTRTTGAERDIKNLTRAVGDLGDALGNLREQTRAVGDLRRQLATEEVARGTARLALASANAELAQARLSGSAFRLHQAQNGVLVAEQNLLNVEHQLATLRGDLVDAERAQAQAQREVQAELDATSERVEALIFARQRAIRTIERIDPDDAANVEREAVADLVEELEKQAVAEERSHLAGSQAAADRLRFLSQLLDKTKDLDLASEVAAKLFNNPDLRRALQSVINDFARTGNEAGKEMAKNIADGLGLIEVETPLERLLRLLKAGMHRIGVIAGEELGASMGLGIVPSLRFLEILVLTNLSRIVNRAVNQTTTLLTQVGIQEITGATLGAQLTTAREAERRGLAALPAAQEEVRRAQKEGGDRLKKAIADRDALIAQIRGAQAEIGRIEGEQASAQAEAQRKRDEKLQEAEDARDKADQRQQDLLAGGEARFALRRARVEATESLQDDLIFFLDYQVFLRKEIQRISTTIHDQRTKTQLLQNLRAEQNATNLAIRATTQGILKGIADRERQRFEEAQESIDLDIQIAQDRENVRAEIRAHEAKIRLLRKRIEDTHATGLALKRLQAAIADEQKAIRDLKKQVADEGNDFLDLQHEFLVRQQGFAATILSNILPLNVVAGSVQGGAISTPTGGGRLPLGQSGELQRRGLGDFETRAFAQGAGGRGATAGQAGQQIDILRAILVVLRRLAGETTHPEATTHRVITKNTLDTTYGV